MNAQDILDSVNRQVNHLVAEGMSAMHTDEAIETTIVQNWLKYGDAIQEDIQMLFLMLLVIFELRRRETMAHVGVH